MPFSSHLASVRARLVAAAQRVGRDPAEITLIAVSKTHPAEAVRAAAELGQVDFGENRIEEALPKMAGAGLQPLRWHMIGHIQSRKAADVIAAKFDLVHSVDSVKLAERLSRFAQAAGRRQAVLLECNVSGEASKEGFALAEERRWLDQLPIFEQIAALPNLALGGLMTMAPWSDDPEQARPVFRRLRALREFLRQRLPRAGWEALSMGMTDDFEVAIEEGATLLRVGRALFGERA